MAFPSKKSPPEAIERTLASLKDMLNSTTKNAPPIFSRDERDNVFVLTDIVKKGKELPSKPPQKTISEVQKLIASIQETSKEVTQDALNGDFEQYIKQSLQEAVEKWVNKNLPDLMHTALQNKSEPSNKGNHD